MDYSEKRFIVGIDLGTTNSAVSYVDIQSEPFRPERIRIFKIPQITGAGEVSRLSVLPSFLYIPGAYDVFPAAVRTGAPKRLDLTAGRSDGDPHPFVGAFARDHGAGVPVRLVSSAKSWLCHAGVDRHARMLPWGAGEEISRVSPVQATAAYLDHIRRAWNDAQEDGEEGYLEHQMVVITVPASFDEVARDLTVESAALAGLHNVTLLEEPLAAFYSWLRRHERDWSEYVRPGELVLVCDVGGGTTDFTLITLREVDGHPRFERIAVGDHLILGGDNIDLALARLIEQRLGKDRIDLSGDRWKTLCHECRRAKELILEQQTGSHKITLMGRGRRLIAGTLSADLSAQEVEHTVLEGFFPLVEATAWQSDRLRKGITEFGLPYEQDPAITRHLGFFLEKHRDDVGRIMERDQCAPDLILFNGGSLKSAMVQQRIRDAVQNWFQTDARVQPRTLSNPDPDLAVALGAAYYGLVKIGHGVRVGSGSARGYYLEVETRNVRPSSQDRGLAICLVERGLEEGSTIVLEDKRFEVLANQPVSFALYSSSFRSGDRCGDVVPIDDSLTPLPPLRTLIKFGRKKVASHIPVEVEASYTEMGTLAIWCRSLASRHRWRLQFQLREMPAATEIADREVLEASLVDAARSRLQSILARQPSRMDKRASAALGNLIKEIAQIVGMGRDQWPLGLIRNLADGLLDMSAVRRTSAEHEVRWLNLIGFCLRPGFGDGLDDGRIAKLWKRYREGPVYAKSPQVRLEWWIMWRRIAGGLTSGQQRQLCQDLLPMMAPKKEAKVKIAAQERLEIWMAAANLERLQTNDKVKLGRLLLAEMKPKKCRPQHFWALSRIGARVLLYGPLDRVIPADEAGLWIETILARNWRNPRSVGRALAQMARLTGDRMRDVDPALVRRVTAWMKASDPRNEFFTEALRYLAEIVPLAGQEEKAIFGESLPAGIVMHG